MGGLQKTGYKYYQQDLVKVREDGKKCYHTKKYIPNGFLAKSSGSIPDPANMAQLVAGDQYFCPFFYLDGFDGVKPGGLLLADLVAGSACGWFFHPHIYHFP
jgi:hypothetical protein